MLTKELPIDGLNVVEIDGGRATLHALFHEAGHYVDWAFGPTGFNCNTGDESMVVTERTADIIGNLVGMAMVRSGGSERLLETYSNQEFGWSSYDNPVDRLHHNNSDKNWLVVTGQQGCAYYQAQGFYFYMGDPLVHPDIYAMIERVKREGWHLTVMTNLIAANIDRLAPLGVDQFLVGVHGATPVAYSGERTTSFRPPKPAGRPRRAGSSSTDSPSSGKPSMIDAPPVSTTPAARLSQ